MKKNRRVFALLLSMVMSLALCVPVFAAEPVKDNNDSASLDGYAAEKITVTTKDMEAEVRENIMIDPITEISHEPEPYDILKTRTRDVYSADNYDEAVLTWDTDGKRDILQTVSKPNLTITYTYNESNYRTSKTVNDITTTFTYGTVREIPNTLISENRNGLIINYTFGEDVLGSTARCVPSGFEIGGTNYQLIFDSSDLITGIADENRDQIVKYEYADGLVSNIFELNEEGIWKNVTDDPLSIGSINRIRYLGYYFDEETGWYYGDSYYDPTEERYIDGVSISQTNPISIATDVD